MDVFNNLFGKSEQKKASVSSGTSEDLGNIVAALQQEETSAKVKEVSIDSSPKEVCLYIFQNMMNGVTPNALQNNLQVRGFKAKTADIYIQLIQTTMFKGR